MAVYAALLSAMHTVDQLQLHPHPPISLHHKQAESLAQNFAFLQNFLEVHSNESDGGGGERAGLENRIAAAAHAAEDLIESQILERNISSVELFSGLERVINDLDRIKEDAIMLEMKEETLTVTHPHRHLRTNSMSTAAPRPPLTVGLGGIKDEIMNKITRGSSTTIPVVGMAGIGKTTLVKTIYFDSLAQYHFDIRVWVTISQDYDTTEILREIFSQASRGCNSGEGEIGYEIFKCLVGRRYLIVLDDMWDINVWNSIQTCFPEVGGSERHILVTTRLSNLASQLNNYQIRMKFLDKDESWALFCKTVFLSDECPQEMEEVGRTIANGCQGLPLSIAVIGGLLAKSMPPTREYWEYIARNLNSVVSEDDDERCLKVLYTSYKELPAYLKPCFLYMGVFPEDEAIRVSMLIKLWVSEGFLKPISGKILEEVGEQYLKDLVDRNLVLIHENMKKCKVHDLLRDLCLREARNEGFYHSSANRRVVLPERLLNLEQDIQYMDQARCVISYARDLRPPLVDLRLLRTLKMYDKDHGWRQSYSMEDICQLVNLRYISVTAEKVKEFCSFIPYLWNLQTLILNIYNQFFGRLEIWKMRQLRHVDIRPWSLYDPPCGCGDDVVLENLQTLKRIKNFKCSEWVVKGIPNLRKLRVFYNDDYSASTVYRLDNLDRLEKLESFICSYNSMGARIWQDAKFPQSLKKLKIDHYYLENLMEKIGSLPLLEKLVLGGGECKGGKWDIVEGQFRSLRILEIDGCGGLKQWRVNRGARLPRLERLLLCGLDELEEVPPGIGEIATLESVHLKFCSDSAVMSARKIQRKREELGDESLYIRVEMRMYGRNANMQLRGLLGRRRFQVEYR